MKKERDVESSVTIGNVSGPIQGSIIAGGDVTNARAAHSPPRDVNDRPPSAAELKDLLAEIRSCLSQLATERELLSKISSAAPFSVLGAEASVASALGKMRTEIKPEDKSSVTRDIAEAGTAVQNLLRNANTAIAGASDLAESTKPILEKIVPLIQGLGTAASWIARLWP